MTTIDEASVESVAAPMSAERKQAVLRVLGDLHAANMCTTEQLLQIQALLIEHGVVFASLEDPRLVPENLDSLIPQLRDIELAEARPIDSQPYYRRFERKRRWR